MRPWFAAAMALVGIGLVPGASRADFTFYDSNGAFQQGLNQFGLTDQNVLFNGPGSNPGPGLTVSGRTNQSDQVVDITGQQNLITPASGQARVTAETGNLTTATIHPADPALGFSSLSFAVNPVNGSDANLTLTVLNQNGGTGTHTLPVTPGLVFFGVIASNGQVITQATIESSLAAQITDIRQIRVGLVPVPEPGSLALFGIGLASAGALGAWRRRARASAG